MLGTVVVPLLLPLLVVVVVKRRTLRFVTSPRRRRRRRPASPVGSGSSHRSRPLLSTSSAGAEEAGVGAEMAHTTRPSDTGSESGQRAGGALCEAVVRSRSGMLVPGHSTPSPPHAEPRRIWFSLLLCHVVVFVVVVVMRWWWWWWCPPAVSPGIWRWRRAVAAAAEVWNNTVRVDPVDNLGYNSTGQSQWRRGRHETRGSRTSSFAARCHLCTQKAGRGDRVGEPGRRTESCHCSPLPYDHHRTRVAREC